MTEKVIVVFLPCEADAVNYAGNNLDVFLVQCGSLVLLDLSYQISVDFYHDVVINWFYDLVGEFAFVLAVFEGFDKLVPGVVFDAKLHVAF